MKTVRLFTLHSMKTERQTRMKTIIIGLFCAGACGLQAAEPNPPEPAKKAGVNMNLEFDAVVPAASNAKAQKPGLGNPGMERPHVGPETYPRAIYSWAEVGTYKVPPELKNFRKATSLFILTNAAKFGIKADDWMSDASSILHYKGTYHCWVIHQYNVKRSDGNSWVLHITTTDTTNWMAVGYVPLGPKGSCYDNQINSGDVVFHDGKWYFFGGASSTDKTKTIGGAGIVCLVANAPEGPWQQVGDDYLLKPGGNAWESNFGGLDNPEIIHLNGKWFMYYKTLAKSLASVPRAGRFTVCSVAVSDSLTGPYKKYERNPLFQAHGVFAFRYKQGIVMMPFGSAATSCVMWSEDGLHFTAPLENDYYTPLPQNFFMFGSLYVPHDPLFGAAVTDKPVTKYWGLDNIKTKNWHFVRMEWEFGPSKRSE